MGDGRAAARGRLVRALIEECWSDQAGLDRMAGMLAPGYVHHTPWGDWDFTQFRAGLDYVDSVFRERRYRVVHVVDDGRLVAAFLAWSAVRRADQSPVDGVARTTAGSTAIWWPRTGTRSSPRRDPPSAWLWSGGGLSTDSGDEREGGGGQLPVAGVAQHDLPLD